MNYRLKRFFLCVLSFLVLFLTLIFCIQISNRSGTISCTFVEHHICAGLLLDFIFCFIDLFACLHANIAHLDSCNFIINFEVRWCESSNFIPFLGGGLAIISFWHFSMNFTSSLSISTKIKANCNVNWTALNL